MESGDKIELSTFDVMKILGLERERLRAWLHYEYIPIKRAASGRGTKAIFSLTNVYNIAIFKKLIEAGLQRGQAKIYIENNKELSSYEKIIKIKYILFFRGDAYTSFQTSSEDLLDLEELGNFKSRNKSWNLGVVINFKKLRDEIDRAIDSL